MKLVLVLLLVFLVHTPEATSFFRKEKSKGNDAVTPQLPTLHVDTSGHRPQLREFPQPSNWRQVARHHINELLNSGYYLAKYTQLMMTSEPTMTRVCCANDQGDPCPPITFENSLLPTRTCPAGPRVQVPSTFHNLNVNEFKFMRYLLWICGMLPYEANLFFEKDDYIERHPHTTYLTRVYQDRDDAAAQVMIMDPYENSISQIPLRFVRDARMFNGADPTEWLCSKLHPPQFCGVRDGDKARFVYVNFRPLDISVVPGSQKVMGGDGFELPRVEDFVNMRGKTQMVKCQFNFVVEGPNRERIPIHYEMELMRGGCILLGALVKPGRAGGPGSRPLMDVLLQRAYNSDKVLFIFMGLSFGGVEAQAAQVLFNHVLNTVFHARHPNRLLSQWRRLLEVTHKVNIPNHEWLKIAQELMIPTTTPLSWSSMKVFASSGVPQMFTAPQQQILRLMRGPDPRLGFGDHHNKLTTGVYFGSPRPGGRTFIHGMFDNSFVDPICARHSGPSKDSCKATSVNHFVMYSYNDKNERDVKMMDPVAFFPLTNPAFGNFHTLLFGTDPQRSEKLVTTIQEDIWMNENVMTTSSYPRDVPDLGISSFSCLHLLPVYLAFFKHKVYKEWCRAAPTE